jgi:hypothetical protein
VGAEVLRLYHDIVETSLAASAPKIAVLEGMLRPGKMDIPAGR